MTSTVGVVFDIDGVLMHGATAIAGAREALCQLQRHNVPFLFMTNGSGDAEHKAVKLVRALSANDADVPCTAPYGVEADKIIMAHTPLKRRDHDDVLSAKPVLLVAHSHAWAEEIARYHNWTMWISLDQLAAAYPGSFPVKHLSSPHGSSSSSHEPSRSPPPLFEPTTRAIEAVVIVQDPTDWGEGLQLVVDVVRGGGRVGTVDGGGGGGQLPVYVCNLDLVYQDRFPLPRFTTGAFFACLQTLYRMTTAHALHYHSFGKPLAGSYHYAEELFARLYAAAPQRIYMIGDNPDSDIKGANAAGSHWSSVLVRTGCFKLPGNDPTNPADLVFDDVRAAVTFLIQQHCQLEATSSIH